MDRRLKEQGTLSYISTDAFDDNFFNYVITSSAPTFVKVGSLVAVTGATSLNCPAGRILRENGKKLYPGAHPGVNTYMVGVFDNVSGLKGYINPNDPMFAPYNTERPLDQKDSVYTGDNQTKNLGPSVLTLGQVLASGDVTTAGDVVASRQIRSSTVSILQIIDGVPNIAIINVSNGHLFEINMTKDVSIVCGNLSSGAMVYLVVHNITNNLLTLSFLNSSSVTIRSAGNLNIAVGKIHTVQFICESDSQRYEVGRSAARS